MAQPFVARVVAMLARKMATTTERPAAYAAPLGRQGVVSLSIDKMLPYVRCQEVVAAVAKRRRIVAIERDGDNRRTSKDGPSDGLDRNPPRNNIMQVLS